MRHLILSDVHANAQALEAVLEDAAGRHDDVLVLGDLVGYGGSPNEVVERLRRLPPAAIIRGNHDRVGAGLEDGSGFNPAARAAATWARRTLSPANLDWLRNLPRGPLAVDSDVILCHGSPADEDAYIFSPDMVLEAFDATAARIVLFGHTHLPMALRLDASGRLADRGAVPGRPLDLAPEDCRWLVNPGSVGQPRDGDSRAACCVLDTAAWTLEQRRVPYDVAGAQAAILAAGLPRFLADRLAVGA